VFSSEGVNGVNSERDSERSSCSVDGGRNGSRGREEDEYGSCCWPPLIRC